MRGWDPAFPYQPTEQAPKPDRLVQGPGLTKRELFAAMAMQAMMCPELPNNVRAAAKEAVVVADALLIELGIEPKEKKK